MARIDLVSTVGAKSDPENQSHTIISHHSTFRIYHIVNKIAIDHSDSKKLNKNWLKTYFILTCRNEKENHIDKPEPTTDKNCYCVYVCLDTQAIGIHYREILLPM